LWVHLGMRELPAAAVIVSADGRGFSVIMQDSADL
jgi:hypothetical protein